MPISIIPFNMPEPAEIPPHIVASLEAMSPDEAVAQGMDLLLGIEAADTIVYERIGQGVVHTAGAGAEVSAAGAGAGRRALFRRSGRGR